MAEFLRRFGFNDAASPQPRRPSPTQGHSYQPSPMPNSYSSPAPSASHPRPSPQNPHAGYHHPERDVRHTDLGADAYRSARPAQSLHVPAYSASPASSPQRPLQFSPIGGAPGGLDWSHASVEDLRAERDRRKHALDVLDSRLKHCIDGGDGVGAGLAARAFTDDKRLLDDLVKYLHWAEARLTSEQRIKAQISQRFGVEKKTVQEHHSQVLAIKQRLRVAFSMPPSSSASSQPPSPSPGSQYSSPQPPHSSPSPPVELHLCDLFGRLKQDLGRHTVSLERQCLKVDSIELQVCVDAVTAAATPPAEGEGEGQPAWTHSSTTPPPCSEELTTFFKASRKDVVTTLQGVLAEIDGLTQHLRHTEAFMDFLQER